MTCVTRHASAENESVEMHCALVLGAGCIMPSVERRMSQNVPFFDRTLGGGGVVFSNSLSEDFTKCLDTYCNTNLYVSTTVFITQGNM